MRSTQLLSPRQGYRIPLLVILILLHVGQKWFEIGEIKPMVELNFRVLKYLEGPLVVKSLITNPKLSSTIFFAKETGKY